MATGNSAAKIKNEGTNVEADIVIDLETAHMKDIQKNLLIYQSLIQVFIWMVLIHRVII